MQNAPKFFSVKFWVFFHLVRSDFFLPSVSHCFMSILLYFWRFYVFFSYLSFSRLSIIFLTGSAVISLLFSVLSRRFRKFFRPFILLFYKLFHTSLPYIKYHYKINPSSHNNHITESLLLSLIFFYCLPSCYNRLISAY